jgi:exodeoxyribonuclease V beta subunit
VTAVRYPMPAAIAAMEVSGHHAVEASAGTGKTWLIERRVVDLVLRGGATIDQVLLVTFTEKATAELRRRVRALFRELATLVEDRAVAGEPAWTVDAGARGQLRAALAGFDQAAIHTIHGFCHRVLIDSAFDGARRFRETQIGTETALREALFDALRDQLAGSEVDGPLLEAWFGQKRSVDQLARRLSEITRLRGRLVQAYRPDAIVDQLAALAGFAPEEVGAALKQARVNAQTARAVVSRVQTLGDLAARAGGGLPPLLDELAAASGQLREYLERPQLAAAAPDLAAAVASLDDAVVPLDAAIATRFLPVVGERLAANKAERGQLDFGDMLEQVWRALDGPGGAELAARLRGRHPHALIDEFQDTDELQWSIFRRIYLEAPAGQAHLTVVGDPKQAIYGFRGADLATYLAAREEVLAGREPVRLEVSYRSSERLLAGLDGILGGERPFFSGGIEYRPVSAGRPGATTGDAPLRLFDLGGISGAEERRAALAARISREIAGLTAGGVAPEEIFVLTRTVKESREMAERLRSDGVRCALYQQEGLLQTAEAAEVRDLFAAIAAPRDRSARLRAWQTRFFAVELGALEPLAEAGDGHPLVERLFAWRELADRLDYERLLPRILRDSRLCERQLVLAPSERALTNFLHLFEIVLDEMLADRCDVAELARRLGRWIVDTEDSEERNVQRLESERDAVQIMTVHRAKGLEAEVVFLYGGDGQGRQGGARVFHAGGERRLFIGSPVPPAIKEAAAAEERGETERLLYVGLTRAARRLYLPCWPAAAGGKKLAEILNGRVQHWLESGGLPGVVEVEKVAPPDERAGAQAARTRALATWSPPELETLAEPALDPAVARALYGQRGTVSTSYTRLKQADVAVLPGHSIDEEDDEVVIDLAPADGVPRGRRVGIFLHEVLEVLPLASVAEAADLASWSALPAVDGAIRTAAVRHDLDPDQEAWRRMVWDALVRPIDLGGGDLVPGVGRALRHCREVEFVFPLAGADGRERALLRGAIDLVFEHRGRVFWLDWKSDTLPDFSPDAVARHVRAEYALQADIYSLALARMLGIADQADHEARFGGLIYLFLRGAASHVARPTHADLIRIERALGDREALG